MTVRVAAKTTFTITVFLLGLMYLINNYLVLLTEQFPDIIPQIYLALSRWTAASYYAGVFYSGLVVNSLILILLACLLDAIINQKVALGLLSSINIPFLFLVGGIVLLFISQIPILVLGGIFLFMLLLGMHLTIAKLLKTHLKTIGVYNSAYTSSIKGVYRSIRKIIETEISGDSEVNKGNLIDRIALYLPTSLIFVFIIITFISIVVYSISYWEYILHIVQEGLI